MFAKTMSVIALFVVLASPAVAQKDCYAGNGNQTPTTSGPGGCLMQNALLPQDGGEVIDPSAEEIGALSIIGIPVIALGLGLVVKASRKRQ